MKVLYYFTYLFFKKVMHDDDAHSSTVLSICADFGFIVTAAVSSIMGIYCYDITGVEWVSIYLLTGFIVYLYFKNKGERIVAEEPLLLNNRYLSIFFAIGFSLFSYSSFIAGAVIGKMLHYKCH